MADLRDRIVDAKRMRLGDLKANPKNYREHPQHQREAMARITESVGYVGAVLVYRDGDDLVLIDGHMRTDEYPDHESMVLITDLSADEADAVLLTYDPISAMAEENADKRDALMQAVEAKRSLTQDILSQAKEKLADENYWGDYDGDLLLTAGDVPDALWPTDNDYEIPLLDITMQADAVDLPVEMWGASKRKRRMNGTWLFYIEDYRFQALWDDPTPVVNTGCVTVAEPNFSCYRDMPLPVGLWAIYRKRWLGRYWQSLGKRLFVDLNVNEKFYDLNMMGVPQGWKAYTTRGYSDRVELTRHEYEMAQERAGSESILFVVYGGGQAVQAEAKRNGWIWIPEQQDVAKGRYPAYTGEVSDG